jgi:hypothetical protein
MVPVSLGWPPPWAWKIVEGVVRMKASFPVVVVVDVHQRWRLVKIQQMRGESTASRPRKHHQSLDHTLIGYMHE